MWIKNTLYRFIQNHRAKQILQQDSKLKLTDIYKLSYPHCNLPMADFSFTNASYGHAFHLKRFAGIDINSVLNCAIEHGMNISGENIVSVEVSHPISTILTYSDRRKQIIERQTDLNAVTIGPYIAYAEDYCPLEELTRLKRKLGRTLLVVPVHGNVELEFDYDYRAFIKKIKESAQDFDSVLVCEYYHEINLKNHEPYEKAGFKVVSAGVGDNRYFLSRLKMIIQLADAVIGSVFTTGLAYALYFDKPVYCFRQTAKYINKGNNNVSQLYVNHEVLNSWYKVCSDPSFGQLDKQKRWGEYYFGFNNVKTREELRDILLPLSRK